MSGVVWSMDQLLLSTALNYPMRVRGHAVALCYAGVPVGYWSLLLYGYRGALQTKPKPKPGLARVYHTPRQGIDSGDSQA